MCGQGHERATNQSTKTRADGEATRDLCGAAGMVLRQKGDTEGAFSFNPENREHVQLAIKLAGVKRKRQMSEKQKAVAEAALRLEWRRSARGMRVHQCLRSFGGRGEKKLDEWCSVLVMFES